MKFLLASLKMTTLLILKIVPKAASNLSVPAFLCSHWSFFQGTFLAGFPNNFSGSPAGYGTTCRDTGGYQKNGTSSQKRVTGMNCTISTGK
jgi:hypothetical protein